MTVTKVYANLRRLFMRRRHSGAGTSWRSQFSCRHILVWWRRSRYA